MDNPTKKQRAITSQRVDPTKPASVVINLFGGLSAFCRITGFATSTAHGWTVSGYIPQHRKGESVHQTIVQKGAAANITVPPTAFVDAEPAQLAANG